MTAREAKKNLMKLVHAAWKSEDMFFFKKKHQAVVFLFGDFLERYFWFELQEVFFCSCLSNVLVMLGT